MAVVDKLVIVPAPRLETPFPLHMEGTVVHGFGRGSTALGFPTANLPFDDKLVPWVKSGVYFGWASLRLPPSHTDFPTASSSQATSDFIVFPMVMSIGCNDFYKTTVPSVEVHVLHKFGANFYGVDMRIVVTGFIRKMRDYPSVEALVADITLDCDIARQSLDSEAHALWETDKGTLDGRWLVREAETAQ